MRQAQGGGAPQGRGALIVHQTVAFQRSGLMQNFQEVVIIFSVLCTAAGGAEIAAPIYGLPKGRTQEGAAIAALTLDVQRLTSTRSSYLVARCTEQGALRFLHGSRAPQGRGRRNTSHHTRL